MIIQIIFYQLNLYSQPKSLKYFTSFYFDLAKTQNATALIEEMNFYFKSFFLRSLTLIDSNFVSTFANYGKHQTSSLQLPYKYWA